MEERQPSKTPFKKPYPSDKTGYPARVKVYPRPPDYVARPAHCRQGDQRQNTTERCTERRTPQPASGVGQDVSHLTANSTDRLLPVDTDENNETCSFSLQTSNIVASISPSIPSTTPHLPVYSTAVPLSTSPAQDTHVPSPPRETATSESDDSSPLPNQQTKEPPQPVGFGYTAPLYSPPSPTGSHMYYTGEVVPAVKDDVRPNAPYWEEFADDVYDEGKDTVNKGEDDKEESTTIPGQSYMGLAVVVTMCFNCPIGALAIFISMSALTDFKAGNDKRGKAKAKWSMFLSLFGVILTVAVMMGIVYHIAYKNAIGNRGYRGYN